MLTADGHIHTEFSWDATGAGHMQRSCERAVALGLPSIAFTDHADFAPWPWPSGTVPAGWRATVTEGLMTVPPFPVQEYLTNVERCRDMFPGLRILSGVELSEPHWHPERTRDLLGQGSFDRLLGSVHCLPASDGGHPRAIDDDIFDNRPTAEVIRTSLAEVTNMIKTCDQFAVLAHIDYPVRCWPADAEPFDPDAFEDEFREALGTLKDSGRALEINTQLPLAPRVVQWWRDAGGEAVTFGSDAHDPETIARGFADAAAMAEAYGFRPGQDPFEMWGRA
jgi:histidinol-phosphatase (PHP family)